MLSSNCLREFHQIYNLTATEQRRTDQIMRSKMRSTTTSNTVKNLRSKNASFFFRRLTIVRSYSLSQFQSSLMRCIFYYFLYTSVQFMLMPITPTDDIRDKLMWKNTVSLREVRRTGNIGRTQHVYILRKQKTQGEKVEDNIIVTDGSQLLQETRSSATAKNTARLSYLVGVLYDIYRETNNRSTANQPLV